MAATFSRTLRSHSDKTIVLVRMAVRRRVAGAGCRRRATCVRESRIHRPGRTCRSMVDGTGAAPPVGNLHRARRHLEASGCRGRSAAATNPALALSLAKLFADQARTNVLLGAMRAAALHAAAGRPNSIAAPALRCPRSTSRRNQPISCCSSGVRCCSGPRSCSFH